MTKATIIKKLKRINPLSLILFIILAFYAFTIIFVLGWGFSTSLKSHNDFADMGNIMGLPDPKLSQREMFFGNYLDRFINFNVQVNDQSYYSAIFGKVTLQSGFAPFHLMLINTIIYAILCPLVHVFTTLTVAYLCAKFKYKFCEFLYALLLAIMALPIVGSAPSMIKVLRDLGLFGSYFGMIAINLNCTGLYFFVFYAFMQGLSDTYIEAAEIDGASQLHIFLLIIVPLASKMFFTVFLLQFITAWNDYQTPLLYFPNMPTLAYGVVSVAEGGRGKETYIPMKATLSMILALPLIFVFISCKNVILGNMTMGGLKE